jgi:tetratricopeptide (TPR) repeat protein
MILDSWKEISAYLNRSVMTCQRWEKQLDLPVHRLDGTPRARVFAYPEELDRWLTEKLHSREAKAELERTRTGKFRRLAAMTAAGLMVLGMASALAWRFYFHPIVPVPAQVPVLAVLPFENKTGDPSWDAWKLALPDLLTFDLRQSRFLDAIKTSAIYQAVGPSSEAETFSVEDLKAIAAKTEAGCAVTGSIVKSGRSIVLAARVYDAVKGALLGSPSAGCRTELDVFSAVDRLSTGIKAALKIGSRERRGDIDRPVARITTASPQAFKSLSTAYRAQGRSRDGAGKFDDAVAPLLEAVKIDPEFGLAYRYLHYTCRALSRSDEAKTYGAQAVRLTGRIAERERHQFLCDLYGSDLLDQSRSRLELERLRADYPYDIALSGLAVDYDTREEFDKAVPVLEKLILRYPRRISVLPSLIDVYQSMGRYKEAEDLLNDRLGSDPEPGRYTSALLESRYRLALTQGQFDLARDCIERLKGSGPDAAYYSEQGFIYFLQDDLANAEQMYRKILESDNKRMRMRGFEYLAAVSLARGRIEEAKQRALQAIEQLKSLEDYGAPMEKPLRHLLAYLERLSGRLPEALKEIEMAVETGRNEGLIQVLPVLYLRALITLELGRVEEFGKQAEEIRRLLDGDWAPFGSPRYMRVYYDLLGHRELHKKNYDQAIQYFWKAVDLISPLAAKSVDGDHAKYFFDLAEADRLSGDLSRAVPMYEKAVLLTVSREFSGDLYAKSFYWQGVDAELQMNSSVAPDLVRERREKAMGHYRKFLGLWGNADPIFPEVEDARKRLAALEAR